MVKRDHRTKRSSRWHLYWFESDGIEDCFVVARNARSACSVELHMNGFDPSDLHAVRISPITSAIERSYFKSVSEHKWPGYVYGRRLFENLGAEFRTINGEQEMLLADVVYGISEFAPCGITRKRSIGLKGVSDLQNDPVLRNLTYHDEDTWNSASVHLLTGLGMCMATCQLIEYYIAHSFLLGVSRQQKNKHKTINDLVAAWKKKTLGNMLASMEEAWELEPLFKANLQLFVTNRNLLVHGITTDDQYDIRTHCGREELVTFLTFFDIHARIVKRAFRASYYASIGFAVNQWGRPEGLTRRMFGRKHEKESDLFFLFFKPRDGAI